MEDFNESVFLKAYTRELESKMVGRHEQRKEQIKLNKTKNQTDKVILMDISGYRSNLCKVVGGQRSSIQWEIGHWSTRCHIIHFIRPRAE